MAEATARCSNWAGVRTPERSGVDGHGDDAADGAGDEGDSRLTIVGHVKYCREKMRVRRDGFAPQGRDTEQRGLKCTET